MKKYIISLLAALLLAGCLHEPIHQGNRLKENSIYQVSEGDTKFQVEQALGTPVLDSSLHPNRVLYFEEFEDEESGEMKKRGIEIEYNEALRVQNVRHFGFEEKK